MRITMLFLCLSNTRSYKISAQEITQPINEMNTTKYLDNTKLDYLNNTTLDENDQNYKDIDYYWYEVNRRTPFIIWTKDEDFKEMYSQEITKVSGMIDISPTILNMLGLYNKYALGEDLFANFDK